jgi:hypothetical protein
MENIKSLRVLQPFLKEKKPFNSNFLDINLEIIIIINLCLIKIATVLIIREIQISKIVYYPVILFPTMLL